MNKAEAAALNYLRMKLWEVDFVDDQAIIDAFIAGYNCAMEENELAQEAKERKDAEML